MTTTRMRTPSLGRTYQFSIFIRDSDDVTWYFTVSFEQRTRVCECICEIHSTTNMILCVCYETIAHATSQHKPPHASMPGHARALSQSTQEFLIAFARVRVVCVCVVCVCVRDKGASIKRVFLGPTLSHFLCKYFERVRVRGKYI